MRARTLGRHVKEGGRNIVRNGWMTFASVSAVTVMLLVVGTFMLLIMNVNHFADTLEGDVEVRVFVERQAEAADQEQLETEITRVPGVDDVAFVPREEGLDNFIASLGDEGEYFETLREENPLNDVFVVQAEEPERTDQVAGQIDSLTHVEDVEYGSNIFNQLFAATDLVRIVGLVLITGLLFTAVFLIANTIKLTIVARKKEIQIMKFVGATNSFIRWPFFIEGLLLGILGCILPIGLLVYGYGRFYDIIGQNTGLEFFEFLPPQVVLFQTAILLLTVGAVVGVWGSLMSVRKFLRV
ncbi:permease-like cell division protein FtsX [Alkalicoccus urumqiensis]|uniref:Cell division protein FtsX n=1 Tax=Alkalicoccus urumqiensis TaxID=1548213 RepID=A0A2P6MH48_ALKUR|nr:permease-like cell division protein FtsX [Alkalicoccus urumqiensis]PRO65609.1 cell division protein FtsX [Alkalicoccus urumqiensis]